ncbi:MAG: LUD domain-containing protein [Alphaproteobacteria bacterium]|nr:LUD domain-containing protein [Alphaproteobacteria bacterium]MDE2110416.1 LUD domain-containing protein [Alphaproteobacteria bacterium]MDE2493425.1 LUD domain-containing protein [Alphaproteobacteria bacterium]
MSSRDDILSTIRMRRSAGLPRPPRYAARLVADDLSVRFAERAMAEAAEVRFLDRLDEVPAAVAHILRARNLAAPIHLPPDVRMDVWSWDTGIIRERTLPEPDDAALAIAPFAIAETGTLVYSSSASAPASWHFRPGLEIAVVAAANILPRFEDVLTRMKNNGALATTINLVTGPSRTGDIEQTLELGAHGPKALSILVVKS